MPAPARHALRATTTALLALALALPCQAAALASATLALSSSRPVAAVNQPITFTATVSPTPPAGGQPSGQVTFLDGGAVLGSATLTGGVATFTVRSLARGAHAITASTAGDADFAPASGALAGGQPVADTPPVAGAGQAATFDGQAQEARVEDPGGALDGARTIELWFEAAPVSVAGPACLVQQGEGDGLRVGLCLSAARDQLVVRRGFETTFIPIALGPGWHHLALSAGDVDTLVHLDDTVFSPLLGTLRARHGQPLLIGAAPQGAGATDRFAGSVDELRLWSTARTAAELQASARQPVRGDAAGLLALWRMDEGRGGSLFDAGPAHLEAALGAPGAETWGPSGAWRRRTITSPRALAPFLAGYDADGDDVTATVAVPAQHGLATAGASVSYLPAPLFEGLDGFTCEVANPGGTSRYATEVAVPAPVPCAAHDDSGEGQACVAAVCVATERLRTGAGGCSAAGQGAPAGLLALLLLALLRRRPASAARPWRRR